MLETTNNNNVVDVDFEQLNELTHGVYNNHKDISMGTGVRQVNICKCPTKDSKSTGNPGLGLTDVGPVVSNGSNTVSQEESNGEEEGEVEISAGVCISRRGE